MGKKRVGLSGSERTGLSGAQVVGVVDPDLRIRVVLMLRPGAAMPAAAWGGKSKPQERTYLTREEFAARYGADAKDVAKVDAFASEHGLDVGEINVGGRTMVLLGPVHAMCKAFNVALHVYSLGGRSYRGRSGPIEIPEELGGVVQAVLGLDDRPQAKAHFRPFHELGGGWYRAQAGVSYLPSEVARLYDYPTGVNGQGQCIALVELGGGYVGSDLAAYFQEVGVSAPQVSSISVGGGGNSPTGDPNGPDGEVMLDIEVAGSVAPGAQIAVYFAENTDAGFLQAVTTAIHDSVRNPSVVSISWGGPEASWTAQAMRAFDQAFEAAGALGVTISNT